MRKRVSSAFLAICFMIGVSVVGAEPSSSQQADFANAEQEVQKVQKVGPAEVALIDQAKLNLPARYIYVPQPQAGQLMRAMGNRENPNLVGIILPQDDKDDWIVVVKFQKSGYIKDDDAKNWDVEELFKSIKAGTEEMNKERKERGFPEIEIVGWVEKPQYDEVKKRLVWSISSRHKGDVNAGVREETINYNTYALGREGYLTLTLVTGLSEVEAQKPIAAELLAATEFVSGKRYEDFNASTDKIAEYGLAALVAGAAAKKLGFFAIISAFVVKSAKLIGLAILAAGGFLTKLFKGRKTEEVPKEAPPEN